LTNKYTKMKKTQFNKFHIAAGGKMVEFAGYEMAVEYTGVKDEHINIRNNVGVFDVSHMGEVWVKGPKAFEFVQKVTTNDVAALTPGKIQYSCFPNGKGGIVDDLLVYHYEDQKYMLVINASNIDKDWAWMQSQNTMGAELENASENISQLAVQGPNAIKALQSLTDINLSEITYYTFKTGKFAGVENVIISATGYTGAGGFEIYMYNSDAEKIWNAIFEAGKSTGIKLAGLASRDTLRLEMGFCLYGNDIDDTTSPIEAGLGWITKFVEGNNFTDREYLENQKDNGVSKKLVGFEMIERGIPRHHYKVVDSKGIEIGHVTSGTMSPMLNVGIGMAYVKPEFSKLGTEIFISIRDKNIKAKVVKMPFYKA
jgi:aminomethyltransferase